MRQCLAVRARPARPARRLAAASAALALAWAMPATAQLHPSTPTLGNPPSYSSRALSSVPNFAAVRTRLWTPRLDDRLVSQGVAAGGGFLWVVAYQSTDQNPDSGPCSVLRIDPVAGLVNGQFALPDSCTSPGGIVWAADGTLYVADRDHLYRIDSTAALAAGSCVAAGCWTLPLGGQVRGPVLALRDDALWIGEATLEFDDPGRMYRFSQAVLRRLQAGVEITEALADRTLSIAPATRGAAVAPDGRIWLAQGNARFGRLQRVEADSGRVLAEYPSVAGLGDLEFGPDGVLWAVSNTGSWRSLPWSTFFPLIFSIDTTALH